LNLVQLLPTFEVFEGNSVEEQSWLIARAYGICNGWRVNLAIDQNGASFGESGKSSDVSSQLDTLLLGKLRSLADVIVTSGKTARVERYKSSKHAPIAIFTRSGDLDTVPAVQGTQYFTPLILTPSANLSRMEQALSDVDVRLIPFEDEGTPWPRSISAALHHEGFQSPVLESGLSTIREFLSAEVIDEFCLTVSQAGGTGLSARSLSEEHLVSLLGDFYVFKLAQLFTDGQTSYSRWVRHGVAASSATA
jgi:riboflavin biosynthesis pyrimidine reductase